MYSNISTAAILGMQCIFVQVEADVSDGLPMFEMVGVLSPEVREARERVRTALKNCGVALPAKRYTINLFPANIRKSGTGYDLPIAVAVLSALGILPMQKLKHVLVIGELGLDGRVLPVRGILPIVSEAKRAEFSLCILPNENLTEGLQVEGIELWGVSSLRETIECFRTETQPKECARTNCKNVNYNIEESQLQDCNLDFSDVQGQAALKRASEIAVSGMHNLLMVGPPGSGKTMIAKRIPSILPPLEKSEQIEIAKIYSVCGKFQEREDHMHIRPFRDPHHTISPFGLSGGGSLPNPGEISLAHKGILFLDELPEFSQTTLEILRQPLEDKRIRLVRVSGSFSFPADFILVAAMNPCKCGYFPDRQKCRCSQDSIKKYLGRISQPLLDRIDISVQAERLTFQELTDRSMQQESSCVIQERVTNAVKKQMHRFRDTKILYNSQISPKDIEDYCQLGHFEKEFLRDFYHSSQISARSYHKILKVARTIADLDESNEVRTKHLSEAVCFRTMDKKLWECEG
ncbi:MAG: YifB family Mg chelatase-like AAA ATPase [Lachnospiraceae bacterium]